MLSSCFLHTEIGLTISLASWTGLSAQDSQQLQGLRNKIGERKKKRKKWTGIKEENEDDGEGRGRTSQSFLGSQGSLLGRKGGREASNEEDKRDEERRSRWASRKREKGL
ncbi:hypothetical protein Cni_G03139 [Canna indica]|uniref:Uncharacterized protein n=1 Tax=Canna indica TaxID=4628 RepID=A0AAQ3JTD4_9LILI|nr:hypothetical protein Cni_G03139 [Canna indica]